MIIKDIFAKDISRNIRGVIKIGQEAETIKKQELEEYVVTDELQSHFKRFFSAYVNSINRPTDATGVWISGFFGSGKSHFLKILSYLLDNSMVAGKRPIDYFRDDSKIKDPDTIQLIEQSEQVPTDVVLFNIDAKADANAAADKSAILTVFLRVFNEKLGYDSNPSVANLERWLDDHSQYQAFKDAFYKGSGSHWVDVRNSFSFIKNSVKEALVQSGAMTEGNAADCLSNMGNFTINPEEFAGMVKKYLDKKGNNHHIIFLADEVGQFIGDNGDRMLNLQTIVEQLQTQCAGQAWVIVTSQQQIDEVTANFTNQKREDLSKIQGRFNTMINMSSANANEVIQKRLLAKKPMASDQLAAIFEENHYNINNKINFSDQVSRKKYADDNDFITNYPFIPYQFDLLKDVLGAVRKHGAEGKHMSDGERSLLATFQAATVTYEDDKVGRLVPFSAFFRGMYEFLSHDHQVVFTNAEGNDAVCPNGNHDTLAMQVLEILFMVKYLDNFPATLENITTLLIDGIFTDREDLTSKVKKALELLISQKYVQLNVETYEFLTDKEQDVNEAINNYEVDDTYIINKIGGYLIGDKYLSDRYVPKHMGNQYVFNFNIYIDGSAYGRSNNNQSLRIVTPLNPAGEEQYRMTAQSGSTVVLVLPDNNSYISNFRRVGQIEQYIQKSAGNLDNQEGAIRLGKIDERKKLEKAADEALLNDLNNSTIYVINDVLDDNTDITSRLNDAYQEVIDSSYRNLSYLTAIKDEKDVLHLLKGTGEGANTIIDDNQQAVQAVIDYLMMKTNQGMQALSMENIRDHFNDIPFGYNDEDIAWLVAKAFKDGKLKLAFNNASISIGDAANDAQLITSYLTKKQQVRKLTLQIVREVPEKQRKAARDFVKDILHKRSILADNDSTEQLAAKIVTTTKERINELNGFDDFPQGPGKALLDHGIELLKPIANSGNNSERTYGLIDKHLDELKDWLEDMDDNGISDFYHSDTQKSVWRRSLDYMDRYNLAKGFIDSDNTVHKTAQTIKENLKKQNISRVVPQLEALNQDFATQFNDLVDELYRQYQDKSENYLQLLKQRLADANFPEQTANKLQQRIQDRIAKDNQIAEQKSNDGKYTELNDQIQLLRRDADQLQREIDETSQQIARDLRRKQELAEQATKNDPSERPHPVKSPPHEAVHTKRVKTIKISDLEGQAWRITSDSDLDSYINQLKQSLQREIDSNDIVNVDFR